METLRAELAEVKKQIAQCQEAIQNPPCDHCCTTHKPVNPSCCDQLEANLADHRRMIGELNKRIRMWEKDGPDLMEREEKYQAIINRLNVELEEVRNPKFGPGLAGFYAMRNERDSALAQVAELKEALEPLAQPRGLIHPVYPECYCDKCRLRKLISSIDFLAAEFVKRVQVEEWRRVAGKVESICSEFGDDPKACIGILGEHFSMTSAPEERI